MVDEMMEKKRREESSGDNGKRGFRLRVMKR
jgi:hypothetical protein